MMAIRGMVAEHSAIKRPDAEALDCGASEFRVGWSQAAVNRRSSEWHVVVRRGRFAQSFVAGGLTTA